MGRGSGPEPTQSVCPRRLPRQDLQSRGNAGWFPAGTSAVLKKASVMLLPCREILPGVQVNLVIQVVTVVLCLDPEGVWFVLASGFTQW